ncbi:MAG: hypothetical protein V7707_11995 [Motiliproteus sp.]
MKRPLFRLLILRQILRVLLLLIVVLAVAFGVIKGYYWYQVRSVVENFGQQLAPVAQLQYGSIETGFDGVAGVRDIKINAVGQTEGVSIAAIRVKAPGLMELFSIKRDIEKGKLPQQLAVEVQGIAIDLSGAMLKQFAAQAALVQPEEWMLGCEAAMQGVTELELLKKLGYRQLVLNLAGDYHFDQTTKLLQLQLSQSVDQMFETELTATVDLGINEFDKKTLALANPSLGPLKIHYRDRSYNQRLVDFCAKPAGESADDFVDRHVALEAEQAAALGLVFSDSLVAAYRDFWRAPGDVRMHLFVTKSLKFSALSQISPEELLQLFTPTLAVNGKPVKPVSIQWKLSGEGDGVVEGVEPTQEQVRSSVEAIAALLQTPFVEPQQAAPAVTGPVATVNSHTALPARSFRLTELDRLPSYNDHYIRIETRNGHLIEGRLLSVEPYELRIYQEVGLGDAVLPIAFKHIAAVRVYR